MTTNHPAHGPVSLDRLHQIREILRKASAQSDGGNLGYAMADAVKVIAGAIAAFGAEPVACPKCNDTGMADSGGVQPWGEPILIECDCRASMLQAEPVSNRDELPLDYLQGQKDGLEWAAQLAEANHPQTGDWLYDDPIELARAIRKGPDMPTSQAGNYPVTPDGWVMVPKEMTPEMMRAVQIKSELGGYAASELSGAYDMFAEFWDVAVSAAPQQEVNNV
ncbi:hypothetical protein [Citrobacter freundii]|uniref:hypothetical protein n=1 Tax=Citrobacter freundii TaxID=546 RepID=UPI0029DB8516|nr:hypothetical protein [Citrobacter freundii]MDX7389730.1 hypothetical protein [Citrobacter freundii]